MNFKLKLLPRLLLLGMAKLQAVMSKHGQVIELKPPSLPSPPYGYMMKVVLGGFLKCPHNHDLSKCHCLYDFGRHMIAPLTVSTLTLTLRPPLENEKANFQT